MQTLILVLAVTLLAYLVYRLWKPVVRPITETPKGKARLYFFHVDWCGHCQKAQPEWTKIENGPHTFGGTTVEFVDVNCEKDKQKCDAYSVEAYPTIKLETSSGVFDYTGRPTQERLTQYLRSSLGSES